MLVYIVYRETGRKLALQNTLILNYLVISKCKKVITVEWWQNHKTIIFFTDIPVTYKGFYQTSCRQLGGHRPACLQSHCQDQPAFHTAE